MYVPNDIWDSKTTLQIGSMSVVLACQAELCWRTVLPHFQCVLQQVVGKKVLCKSGTLSSVINCLFLKA